MTNLAPATAAMLIAAAAAGWLIKSELLAAGVDAHSLRSIFGISKASWQPNVKGSIRVIAVCMWILLVVGLVSLPFAAIETYRQLLTAFR